MPISVLIGDPQRLFAEAVTAALRSSRDLQVLHQHPASGLAAIEAFRKTKPDVALLDYWLNGMNGVCATRMIRAKAPDAKIAILSWFHSQDHVASALSSGAIAFLPKTMKIDELPDAIRRVAASAAPSPCSQDPVWDRLLLLTAREIEILGSLRIHGMARAATELSISPATARLHLHHALQKLGARSQVEAIAMVERNGLI